MELYGIERQAPVFFQNLVDSTNTRIKQLAAQGAPDGTVYIAAAQSAGRGRKGRTFLSPPGGLYLSMLLRPGCSAEEALSITPMAAVAACRAVKQVCGLLCGIKWPNDVVLGGKKLCGILTEASTDKDGLFLVPGIGVNVNTEEFPPELRPVAGSLFLHSGKKTELEDLARALIHQMDELYAAWKVEKNAFLEEYRALCVNTGREVLVGDRPAKALGIAEDYSLLVEYPDGTKENIACGEVSVRGLYGYV
ncbi:MAG: biotin--[acetyl-CoA-carboxylase] ligase [Candidatus Limivicinus sp.]|nr:biotin--[acetyl-CoA-carboxylase] ligase [Candidatus Limivicinus sp.]